jgi:double-stranded uracil-DNA glycosylase
VKNIKHPRPTREELEAARSRTVRDVIAPGLDLLFCGINPGLYTAAIGHHFGRPGNRFWPALYSSGLTDRLLSPYEERDLLKMGIGITNLVSRATLNEQELAIPELTAGAMRLESKVLKYMPKCVAVLGIGAYKIAFRRQKASPGRQAETLGGAVLWVLPNPSGLNAHFKPSDLKVIFSELRADVESISGTSRDS